MIHLKYKCKVNFVKLPLISKDRFYEELEQVFNNFPNYHMKILFRRF